MGLIFIYKWQTKIREITGRGIIIQSQLFDDHQGKSYPVHRHSNLFYRPLYFFQVQTQLLVLRCSSAKLIYRRANSVTQINGQRILSDSSIDRCTRATSIRLTGMN